MAGLRNAHGICPPEVIRFLLDLFKYNDNSKNRYSDNYYRAVLVEALGCTVTPVVSVVQQGAPITSESLSADTKLVLEEVTRMLNLEKSLPSYKYTITCACLKAIRKLQKFGHLPSSPTLFKSYAEYGQFVDVRLAALECLVDFVRVDGRGNDLDHLLNIIETDPDHGLQHKLARMLTLNPPFERAHRHRLDVPELVDRIWTNINCLLSHDTRLRCDLVDLYYKLYGNKRPTCLPIPELAAILKPQKVNQQEDVKKKQLFDKPSTSGIKLEQGVNLTKDKVTDMIIEEENFVCVNEEVVTNVKVKDEIVIEELAMETDDIKVVPKEEYFSDNSVSLPGLLGQGGPVGFEPGMFKKEPEAKAKTDPGVKIKKKKKDKKKHKHKHKHKHDHKHGKDKEKKDKEKDAAKQKVKEETLSSMSSSPSPNTMGEEFM